MDDLALQSEFSFFGLQRIDREKPVWHSTGKLLRKHRPEVYRIAVELLGCGRYARRELCKLLHVSHHTLESVESEQAETLATLRNKAARENMELHRMALERAAELIPHCPDLQKVAVASGIYADKSQLLAGEATARIALAEPIDLVARFGAFVTALEAKVRAREMGEREEKMGAMAPGERAPFVRPGSVLEIPAESAPDRPIEPNQGSETPEMGPK